MCWSAQASFAMAGVGYLASYYEWGKIRTDSEKLFQSSLREPPYVVYNKYKLRTIALIYFASMELLQGFSYLVMAHPIYNALFAGLGYIHISLQPFFISWFILSFVPVSQRKKWFLKINLLAMIATIGMFSHLIKHPSLPGCFGKSCQNLKHMHQFFDLSISGVSGCAQNHFTCYPGEWHMAWKWPLNNCSWLRYGYFIVLFICPIFYGAHRAMLYVAGSAMLAYFMTGNPDEWAAIWCLLSVFCLLAIKIKWIEALLTCPPKLKKTQLKNLLSRTNS